MVALSSARAADNIAVLGPRNLEYAIALLHSGFERVLCVMGDSRWPCSEPVDRLFLSDAFGDAQLAFAIASIGPYLRRDGTVVALLRDIGQDQIISNALKELGLSDLPAAFGNSGKILVSHRLCAPGRFAIAA